MWLQASSQEAVFSPRFNILLNVFRCLGVWRQIGLGSFLPCVQILMCLDRVPHTQKHELKALRVRDRTTEFLIGANLKTQTQFHLLR